MNLCRNSTWGVLQSVVCHNVRHFVENDVLKKSLRDICNNIFSKSERRFPRDVFLWGMTKWTLTFIHTWEGSQHMFQKCGHFKTLLYYLHSESFSNVSNIQKFRYGSAGQREVLIWSFSLKHILVWIYRCRQHKQADENQVKEKWSIVSNCYVP